METLGIYISVPFCRSKCTFCNFASGVFPSRYFEQYIGRVVEDFRGARRRMVGLGAEVPSVVDSVYFGGGTPSILPAALMAKVLGVLRGEEFEVTWDAEITVECAPRQLADDVLAAMVDGGVNRISFGVQSFVDKEVAVVGRLHDRVIALRDIERVRAAGIERVSVDLIAGLPLQTSESWRESLEVLVETGVSHASVYMFEVDEDSRLGGEVLAGGGRFHAGAVPQDDVVAEFYTDSIEVMGRAGLEQYEISNFARRGAESRHNTKYWTRQPYLGFGLDAHSMLHTESGRDVRFAETDDLEGYLRGDLETEIVPLKRVEMLEETWFMGLRRNVGVDVGAVRAEYGAAAGSDDVVDELVADGLLEREGPRVRLAARGRLLSNEVFERFLLGEPETSTSRAVSDLVVVN